jgi:hypothetical protein
VESRKWVTQGEPRKGVESRRDRKARGAEKRTEPRKEVESGKLVS